MVIPFITHKRLSIFLYNFYTQKPGADPRPFYEKNKQPIGKFKASIVFG